MRTALLITLLGQELWRVTPASVYVTVQDGKVTGITITNPGSGYSSAPQVSAPNLPELKLTVKLSFSTDFAKMGQSMLN
jgi:hypothetical protein